MLALLSFLIYFNSSAQKFIAPAEENEVVYVLRRPILSLAHSFKFLDNENAVGVCKRKDYFSYELAAGKQFL